MSGAGCVTRADCERHDSGPGHPERTAWVGRDPGPAACARSSPGEGSTLNCPQLPSAGDRERLSAFEEQVLSVLERFEPQFVLLSAGFDAHRDDPLAQTELTTDGFRQMTRGLLQIARERCGGSLVSLLGGSYDLEALAFSAGACVEEFVRA